MTARRSGNRGWTGRPFPETVGQRPPRDERTARAIDALSSGRKKHGCDQPRRRHEQVTQWLAGLRRRARTAATSRAAAEHVRARSATGATWCRFTWNITTLEGRDGIARDARGHARPRAKPSRLAARGRGDARPTASPRAGSPSRPPSARGRGHLRLKGGKCWTLLTTMTELKGFEEQHGPDARRRASSTASSQDRKTWLESAAAGRGRTRRHHASPTCVIVGGGQGGIGARRAAEAARRADDHRREERAARRLLAQALQVAVPARPGLVRPPALPAVPRPLAGVLAQGQDRRLARDVHQGHGAELLGLAPSARARATTRRSRSGRSTVDRDGETVTLRPKQLVLATGMSGMPNMPRFPAPRRFKGEQHHSSKHPGGEDYRGQEVRGDRLEQLGARHLRRPVGARRRRHDGAALVRRTSRARDTLMELALGGLYSEAAVASRHHHRQGRPDLRLACPTGSCTRFQMPVYEEMARRDADFYARLRARPASCSTSARTARACS